VLEEEVKEDSSSGGSDLPELESENKDQWFDKEVSLIA
jgi:hypothetical protein